MSNLPKKLRGARPSIEQKEQLLEFMQKHKSLAQNKITGFERTKLWKQLSEILNSLGGANKNENQWNKFWNDWKGYTRSKTRDIAQQQKPTGGPGSSFSGKNPRKLSDQEELIISIIGKDSACGDGSTKSLGLTTSKKRKASLSKPENVSFESRSCISTMSSQSYMSFNLNEYNPMPQSSTSNKGSLSPGLLIIDEAPQQKTAKKETKKSLLETINKNEEEKNNILNNINSNLSNINDNLTILNSNFKKLLDCLVEKNTKS